MTMQGKSPHNAHYLNADCLDTNYLVVGAGIMGCTLAYELSKVAKVTLLEQAKVGSNTVPVALLNPYRGQTARSIPLDIAGLKTMYALANELSELGLDHGIHPSGVLRIASNIKQAKKWHKLTGVRWLEKEAFPANYHAPFGGILIDSGGFVESGKFLKALLTAAQNNGASLVEDCHIYGIGDSKDEKGYYLEGLLGGARAPLKIKAKNVFLCVGTDKTFITLLPKLTYTAGEVVTLNNIPNSTLNLAYPLAGAVYATQIAQKIYIGGNHRPLNEEDSKAASKLQRSVSWFIPSLKFAEQASVWTGKRAKTEHNQPILKELKPRLWFIGALAGRGFLCAAYLAKKVAQEALQS